MKQDNEPFIYNTEYYSLLQSMRQTFSRSEYVKRFRASKKSKAVGKRSGVRYSCDVCGKDFAPKDTEVHHIHSVIEIGKHYSDYTLDEYWHRLWCPLTELQLLCHTCHESITQDQQLQRKTKQ